MPNVSYAWSGVCWVRIGQALTTRELAAVKTPALAVSAVCPMSTATSFGRMSTLCHCPAALATCKQISPVRSEVLLDAQACNIAVTYVMQHMCLRARQYRVMS